MPVKKPQSEILTVMFIDIVGYTKTTAQLSREEFTELHDIFDSFSIPIFEKYGGTVIKKIGDAFLTTFKSPTDALLCGIELQHAFDQYNKHAHRPIKIRVAVHTGEVIVRNDDVYGEAVNTASRIEGMAKAGQIVFSEAVFSAMNKKEIPYIHLGHHTLKGVKYPIRLFRIKSYYDEVLRRRRIIKDFLLKLLIFAAVAGLIYLVVRFVLEYSTLLG